MTILLRPEVSVIVPIYNEAGILRMNAEKLGDYMCERHPNHEIILCENGSKDETPRIARGLAEEFENIEFLELPEASLAEALKAGFKAARGEKAVYFPIDLSVDLEFIPESVRLLDMFDVVIGSKRMISDLDRRPFVRKVTSRAYHGMVRGLYDVDYSDTTCVKAYRRSKIQDLLDRVPTSSSIYETELLVEAAKEGLDIVEIPIVVEEIRSSREIIWYKIQSKLQDLLSAKLDRISLMVGIPLFLAGITAILILAIDKMRSASTGGFVNPYMFLLSMLLVISGFQIITLGLFANLIMQIRRQVTQAIKDRN